VPAPLGKAPPPLPAAAITRRPAFLGAVSGHAPQPPSSAGPAVPSATGHQEGPRLSAEETRSFFDELPDELPEDVERLGDLTAIYKGKISGPIAGIVFGALLTGGGVLAIAIMLIFLIRANGGAEMRGPLVALLIAMGCVPLGVCLIVLNLNSLRLRVGLFAEGLLYCKGQHVEVLCWEDIESVLQSVTRQYVNGIYTGTIYRFTLRHVDGGQLVLNNRIKHIETLGPAVQTEVTRRKMAAALEAYDAGMPVKFGKLVVDREGFRYNDAFFPWQDIEEVKVQTGIVMVRKKGKWLGWKNVSVASIPNFFVFLALVDKVVGINRE
jgi:hypothetical protein